MSLIYKEPAISDTIAALCMADGTGVIRDRVFREPMAGTVLKHNDVRLNLNCIVCADEDGLLIMLMGTAHIYACRGYEYRKFDELTGVRIRDKRMRSVIMLVFEDGSEYVMQISKRVERHLPNQNRYIQKLQTGLEMLDRHEMNNANAVNRRAKNRRFSFIYVSTLLVLALLLAFIGAKLGWEPGLMILVFIIAFLVHFMLVVVLSKHPLGGR